MMFQKLIYILLKLSNSLKTLLVPDENESTERTISLYSLQFTIASQPVNQFRPYRFHNKPRSQINESVATINSTSEHRSVYDAIKVTGLTSH